jgi:hypothetical protein
MMTESKKVRLDEDVTCRSGMRNSDTTLVIRVSREGFTRYA